MIIDFEPTADLKNLGQIFFTLFAEEWRPGAFPSHRTVDRLFQPETCAKRFTARMEGVPLHLSLEEIGAAMATVEGVTSVHDLHVWSLTAERIALSAHVMTGHMDNWPETLARLTALLAQRYGIEHVTLQPEVDGQAPPIVPKVHTLE